MLLWLDLEMSGLDLEVHTIVEISLAVTDFQLRHFVEGPDIVIHHDERTLEQMNDWSREQHSKSGLIDLIRQSSISLEEAERQSVQFVEQFFSKGSAILAGNSVFVDRWFIEKYMKKLSSFLHPSIVDCSTLKELTLRWQPVRYTKRPHKKMMHRARDDIRESINELNHYRQNNFLLGFRRIRFPPFAAPPELSNPRTHLVWLKTDSEPVRSVFVVVTYGNLKILNEILVDFNNGENQRSLLLSFLHRNILVNRTSPICGQRVHVDRSRIERCAPEFLSCCHYRSIDIDVLDVLSQQWAPNVFQHRPQKPVGSMDIREQLKESIEVLRFYRENLFKTDLLVE